MQDPWPLVAWEATTAKNSHINRDLNFFGNLTVPGIRAGKSEDGDNTNKPVIANKDNSILHCKEDWEDSRKPPATVPDHVPPTAVTQQSSKPTHSTNTNTGWGNTENACVIDTSSLFSADFCSGLGLANLHLKVYGEDDLGFDPWNECSKGLADLLQEEKQTPKAGSTSLPHTHSFLPPFQSGPGDIQNWQDGLRALLPNINISFSVRPPPGFECKQPSSHLSSVDDPSILWSKTLDPGNPQIRKPTRKPVPNGFPGVHNLTSAANLQNSSAVSSRERLKTSLNDESSQQHISNTNKSVGEFEKNMVKDIPMSKEPSTEKSKNSITEATQRVVTNTKKDFVQQRKTRVSELSVIDVNEPIPTKRIHTPLDYEIMENKHLTSKIQKTRTHRGQVEEKVVRDRRQQDSYPKVGKKLRRNGRIDDQTNPRWS